MMLQDMNDDLQNRLNELFHDGAYSANLNRSANVDYGFDVPDFVAFLKDLHAAGGRLAVVNADHNKDEWEDNQLLFMKQVERVEKAQIGLNALYAGKRVYWKYNGLVTETFYEYDQMNDKFMRTQGKKKSKEFRFVDMVDFLKLNDFEIKEGN